MPVYYFDLRDGADSRRDEERQELAGFEQARDDASEALAEAAKHVVPGDAAREISIEVRDNGAHQILKASFHFAAQR